ncbi:MAG: hypothetical protein ABXS92_00220 [Sulfurimonas sp.]
MNQTQKRLQIINLAISITDIETIQLQVAKLRLLEGDRKVQEIIHTLDAKNFAHAQVLIAEYMKSPTQEIQLRTASHSLHEHTQKEKELIEKFGLFLKEEKEETDFVDIDSIAKNSTENNDFSDYDALLGLNAEDILKENIDIDLSAKQNDDFFRTDDEPVPGSTDEVSGFSFFEEEESSDTPEISAKQNDDFFRTDDEPVPGGTDEVSAFSFFEEEESSRMIKTEAEESEEPEDMFPIKENREEAAAETPSKAMQETTDTKEKEFFCKPLPDIRQKFRDISQAYPALEKNRQAFPSVQSWLIQISNDGFSREDMTEAVTRAIKLSQSDFPEKRAEGTELILLSAATGDNFAKLIFARELYKGNLFKKNSDDAFNLIEELAEDNCPEALCDLGQFYEYGIGADTDRKRAKSLYEKAMKQGLQRAEKHFKRVKSGFFSL